MKKQKNAILLLEAPTLVEVSDFHYDFRPQALP